MIGSTVIVQAVTVIVQAVTVIVQAVTGTSAKSRKYRVTWCRKQKTIVKFFDIDVSFDN